MKTAVILLIVLSALFVGCGQDDAVDEQPPATPDDDTTGEEAITEVDEGLLSENEEIEIGEMI